MKIITFAAETRSGKLIRKELSFPMPDEMAEHIETLRQKLIDNLAQGNINTDPFEGFIVEGNKSLRISLTISDNHLKF